MPEFKIAIAEELQPGQGRTIKVSDLQIALFNVDGKFYAIDDACPHMRADLSCGVLRERTVLCGWHGWEFELETGNCLNVEWAKVRTYPVDLRNGEVFLSVEPLAVEDDEPEDEVPRIVWKSQRR